MYLFRYYKNLGKNICVLIIEVRMWVWDFMRKEFELVYLFVVYLELMIFFFIEENLFGC